MPDTLILRNAQKGEPIPSDDDNRAWQRRYSWMVQAALADQGEKMTPAEAGSFARGAVSKEFTDVNPEATVPDWLTDE